MLAAAAALLSFGSSNVLHFEQYKQYHVSRLLLASKDGVDSIVLGSAGRIAYPGG